MHILCLGVDLFVAGNVLRCIVDSYDFWGEGNDEQKLLRAWVLFKTWAKKSGWKPRGLICGKPFQYVFLVQQIYREKNIIGNK